MKIRRPYLLFLGDADDMLAAKVAMGIKQWRPEYCIGQLRMAGCKADCQLPDMSLAEAVAAGVKTLVVGVANRGGFMPESWVALFLEALEKGLDLAAGLHDRLVDVAALRRRADELGCQLIDVRHPKQTFPVGNGRKRSGKRILTVGTDCSCGKMYTALAIERELRRRGVSATFRATGQTGILISGAGTSIDAVVSDFTAGAMEILAPDNQPNHWDVIEGQGSLFHPSFASVTTGIIHGAQADALVLCHEPTRTTLRGVSYQLPDLQVCMDLNLSMARLTNPQARFVGVSLNTSHLSMVEACHQIADLEDWLKLPVVDPLRQGVARIVDKLEITL